MARKKSTWKNLSRPEKDKKVSNLRQRGFKVLEVAKKLNISGRTVKRHSIKKVKVVYYRQRGYKGRVKSYTKKKLKKLKLVRPPKKKRWTKKEIARSPKQLQKRYGKKKDIRTVFKYYYHPKEEYTTGRHFASGSFAKPGLFDVKYCKKKSGYNSAMKRDIKPGWVGTWTYTVYQRGSHHAPRLQLSGTK